MSGNVFRGVARRALLASTALIALPTAAQAQSAPTVMINYAQENIGNAPISALGAFNSGQIVSAAPESSERDPSIVISQPGTPTTARDTSGPNGVNGVGQMIIDQQNGFIGLCTGTLINPRTVLFAAHCVNENADSSGFRDPWAYGAQQGGVPIAFGFAANNNVGATGSGIARNSAFGRWLFNAVKYQTNAADYLYNVNQVLYHPDSTKLGVGGNFLQADVALASLDRPATNVPTWAVLFSALPVPGAITATTGTGYHVTEYGYGNNGVGTTGGVGGIDYRRRAAENYVGLLGSLDDIDMTLFGEPDGLPQNLYQLDFDDPRRGTASASRFDFNVFKDAALPSEGITAPGDSGGPLVLDRTYAKQVVIGVLSGGSRYFNAQPSGGYGTSSFYQPLYLFWDYIAANNPYRYATAVAGDGKWSDPTHWQTALDPAYNVVVNGQLVNGVPAVAGEGINGTSGKFGQICGGYGAGSACYDTATGRVVANTQTEPTPADREDGTVTAATAQAAYDSRTTVAPVDGMTSIHEAQAGVAQIGSAGSALNTVSGGDVIAAAVTAAALPAATLVNGLPGATNFVPNNIDPNATARTNARYFDVTLGAAGTTTLDTSVTIDRFTITGAQSRLAVTAGASLTSLTGFNHLNGIVQIDGTVNSGGDYLLLSGGLSGSGRINAPFLTNATGMIAPGAIGTIGTLTVGGNLVLASGATLLVDVGPNGTSDRVAVVRNGTTDGIANIGGRVGFAPVAGHTIRYNDVYTIVTAAGGITGAFQTASPLSAILTPQFVYSANAVQARIVAGTYASVVANTPIQTAFAGLLDRNRASNYNALSGLYGTLDIQNAATIQSTLEGLAPRTTPLKYGMGTVATENMSRFYRQHLAGIDPAETPGGTLTMTGQPLQFASLMASDLPTTQATASDTTSTTVREGVLPENVNVFIAGGYVDGDSRSLRDARPFGGRDNFDGFYVVSGLEAKVGDSGVVGFGFGYTKLDGTTGGVAKSARGELFQGTLFAKAQSPTGQVLDAQIGGGVFQASTRRTVAIANTTSTLRSRDNALAVSAEVGLAQMFDVGGFQIGPRVAGRVNHIGFTPTLETGGDGALRFGKYDLNSVQGRAGLQIAGGQTLKPFASAYFVHDFKDQPGVFTANFFGGTAPAGFRLSSQDQNWGEIAAGLSYSTGMLELSVSADTTVERKDVRNQAYRGAIKFKF